jgi:hypothetical protein
MHSVSKYVWKENIGFGSKVLEGTRTRNFPTHPKGWLFNAPSPFSTYCVWLLYRLIQVYLVVLVFNKRPVEK